MAVGASLLLFACLLYIYVQPTASLAQTTRTASRSETSLSLAFLQVLVVVTQVARNKLSKAKQHMH